MMLNYVDLSESDLLVLLKKRDHRAFTELYERTWQSLFKIAYQRLKDKETCKDIVHDVFADLWNKSDVKEIGSLLPYLHTAVRYKIYSWLAKGNQSANFIEPFEHMAVSSVGADSWYELKELENLVSLWIKTLPKKRREIFYLKYMDNLSSKAISQKLNISQKTVQNQLLTAFNGLQLYVSHYLPLLLIAYGLL
ncbi:MAG: sigma-70 family RNA polymerase sigma factor [Mucilaginibacter sp.]|uniref:RNA polymerase sigma factor n=1 Tax=Mucilaginibacter sp. TaxID=1882438 RepID=UPI0032668137